MDWLKELIWAIANDADTKIILSIVIACISLALSIAVLLSRV